MHCLFSGDYFFNFLDDALFIQPPTKKSAFLKNRPSYIYLIYEDYKQRKMPRTKVNYSTT